MTTEESYGWEIVIEPDQKCTKPRLKVRDGHYPTDIEIFEVVKKFETLRGKLRSSGFTVAPLDEKK